MSAPSEQSQQPQQHQRPAQMLSRRGSRFVVRRPAQRGGRGRPSQRVRAQLSSSSSSDSESSSSDSDERVVPLRGRPHPMAAPHPSFLHTYLAESRRSYVAESPVGMAA